MQEATPSNPPLARAWLLLKVLVSASTFSTKRRPGFFKSAIQR
jgi:hypothetical protein